MVEGADEVTDGKDNMMRRDLEMVGSEPTSPVSNLCINGSTIFLIGVPLEERPEFKEWAIENGASKVSVLGSRSLISSSLDHIAREKESIFVIPVGYKMKFADLRLLKENGWRLLGLSRLEDKFLLTPLNIDVEIFVHHPHVQKLDESFPPEANDISHIMFNSEKGSKGSSHLQSKHASSDNVEPDDITMIICIRSHSENPWVLDRLMALHSMYRPAPRIRIVDFGSEPDHSSQIEIICAESGFGYTFVEDKEVFSLAKARNIGASESDTDLLFFSDIDFVFPSDFFAELASAASSLAARSKIDVLLMCSAVHMSETASSEFVSLADPLTRSVFLRQLGYRSIFEQFGKSVQFVAPYSNVFMINKKLFSLAGGYDENFRGHGSEDFEFITRVNLFTGHFPMPRELTVDSGGPTKADFFKAKNYEGFRALNTAISLPGQLNGLRAFHLYHPTPQDDWRVNNDWKRNKLKERMSRYAVNEERIIEIDYLPRKMKALCICLHKDHWGYFAPLRLAGYEIVPIYDSAVKIISEAAQRIISGEVDALAIYNPYMDSHRKFLGLFHVARKYCKTIVVERGALPGSIYYASDVAYASDEFSIDSFFSYTPSAGEISKASLYMDMLRTGGSMLEAGDPYSFTMKKYFPLSVLDKKIIFIPLQMSEDMAVTMFVNGRQKYDEFSDSINDIAADNDDVIFVVKPHPLTKGAISLKGHNVIVADRSDNIHAIIDICDAVVAYNSGVALLAMAHQKPVWTVGNAYFNRGGAGREANSLADAVREVSGGDLLVDESATVRVYAWLLSKLYSEFVATDNVREFQTRKAHGYKDIVVTSLNVDGNRIDMGRVRASNEGISSTLGASLLNYGNMHGSPSS
ncbi:capsular polysaccharide export protein, LipB/KpsS family [Paracoccus caeni]|nr:glycosyltransferase [Paracoccus caeni]